VLKESERLWYKPAGICSGKLERFISGSALGCSNVLLEMSGNPMKLASLSAIADKSHAHHIMEHQRILQVTVFSR
jgi:hypothetical protein